MTMDMAPGSGWWAFSLLAGTAAAYLVIWVILDLIFGRTPIQRRLKSLRVFTVADRKADVGAARRMLASAGEWVDGVEGLRRLADSGSAQLDQLTGAPAPSEWFAIRMACSLFGCLLLTIILPAILGFPLGLIAGFVAPSIYLDVQIRRRRARFADELPGLLVQTLSSLRSGFTLQQSVDASVRDDDGPVAEELSRALSESRISGEFEEALGRVGDRVKSEEMIWLVMALRLQKEVGGSLAEVMQTTADTMRERAYLRRHVRTLSAEGRFSAYILMALPVMTTLALFVLRPEYVRPLYTETMGIALLGVALLMMIAGSLWLRSVTRIEV